MLLQNLLREAHFVVKLFTLSCKNRSDLNIYKKYELEFTFIEIINPRKSNIIVSVIYRHPKMEVVELKNIFLNNLLKKINEEQKLVSFR